MKFYQDVTTFIKERQEIFKNLIKSRTKLVESRRKVKPKKPALFFRGPWFYRVYLVLPGSDVADVVAAVG